MNFLKYAGEGASLTKEVVVSYKQYLADNYAVASANSMLAALNVFLRFLGRGDCVVKAFRVRKAVFRAGERELDPGRIHSPGGDCGKERRPPPQPADTDHMHDRNSNQRASVYNSGVSRQQKSRRIPERKNRMVLLPAKLCIELKYYTKERGIVKGSIFITRSGRPMDRSNILHSMKAPCEEAGVDKSKVFPHNLRHLFAVTYYNEEKDICHLADLLGHSSINTTRIYTLVSCAVQEQSIENLGLLLCLHQNTA